MKERATFITEVFAGLGTILTNNHFDKINAREKTKIKSTLKITCHQHNAE